jgi:hypothetical protein
MKKTDIYSNIEEAGTYKISKPAGVVVTGFNLTKDEERLLSHWNFHLRPHIRIVTYNDLIQSAHRNLESVKCVREKIQKSTGKNMEDRGNSESAS